MAERREVRPFLNVVRGNPTAEELAAVVAVLITEELPVTGICGPARASGYPAAGRLRSGWASRDAQLRQPVHPAPDAWRRSGLRP
jgi:Acyl-CoA carboxylase epsilon subunit